MFYMMCAGAPPELRAKLGITKPDDFHYLKNGCTQYFCNEESEKKLNDVQKSRDQVTKGSLHDPILDDVQGFNAIDQVNILNIKQLYLLFLKFPLLTCIIFVK